MGVFKKGKKWFIDYYVQGKRKRESIGPSKELAQIVLKKRKVQIAENRFLNVKKQKNIRFREMAKLYLESYSKPNKRSWDRGELSIKNLNAFFGSKYLHEINALDIENYKVERRQKVSPALEDAPVAQLDRATDF